MKQLSFEAVTRICFVPLMCYWKPRLYFNFSASAIFIGQPIGSLLSGFITDAIGRRKTMLLVNFPNTLAWLLLSQAKTLPVIFFTFGLFGIGAGLMEAPIMIYLSEIWYVMQQNIEI